MTELKKEKTIIMKAFKYDGKLHYEQPLQLYRKADNHVVLSGAKGRELTHYTRDAVYKFEQETFEYFFTDRWYTAALVFDDDGNVVHVYCNIALPCKITEEEVEFIDLDVDVVVRNGIIEVIDIDEFEEHKLRYGYSKDLQKKVFEAVDTVKSDILRGSYPFDRNILKHG
ncbi:MAG: DUF402 domain-containing protein [Clostridiales bacterium]|nr:DUF402 domain-containing protein [Clostridiales bacterium]